MVNRAPRIVTRGLSKKFNTAKGEVPAVDTVDLELRPGSFTALVGESGCGKTTLMRLLAGLVSPSSGSITVDPPGSAPAVVFQDARLLPWLPVKKNLELALRRVPEAPLARKEIEARIDHALKLVSLAEWGEVYPAQLSGGMAQRVSLARALCRDSGFLLLDEPFSALDALTRERLQADLKEIIQIKKPTVLFITHDIAEADYLADRILVMQKGTLIGDLEAGRDETVIQSVYEIMGYTTTGNSSR